jgi:hypothetical protein
MNRTELRQILHLCAALCALCFLVALAGCKGNTSAAAIMDKPVPPPPHVQAYSTHVDPRNADPLSSPIWTSAHWMSFVGPIGADRTTEASSGAILFDNNTLYVAFVSQKPASAYTQDFVSFYLDSSAERNGSEMMQVSVNATGQATCTWIRDAEPPTGPREDGSADVFHPLSKIPADGMVPGLFAKTGQGMLHGQPVWTAVVAIPVQKLPMPLRTTLAAGMQFKINLLRTTVVAEAGNSGQALLQSNLSPVYVGQQAVAPYRMATLDLADTQVTAAQ